MQGRSGYWEDMPSHSTTAAAIELLDEMHHLMSLRGENVFKVRAFEKASASLVEVTDLNDRALAGTLTEIPGVGKGIAEVLSDFILHGKTTARDELARSIPPALIELTKVPGLGPKKAQQLIDELGIQSLSELEYACKENRLLKLKGFGDKVQKKILDGVEFARASQGFQRLGDVLDPIERLLPELRKIAGPHRVCETGAFRRKAETLSKLEFLIEAEPKSALATRLEKAIQERVGPVGLPIVLHFAESNRFGYELARTTATAEHWSALGSPASFAASSEQAFYEKLGLSEIPPETRETGEEVKLAKKGKLGGLLPWDGIRGVFHNHTVRSDGTATLEQMVVAAKGMGYEYFGISDHSQSAFYAQGLRKDALAEQEREVRDLQQKYPEIRIFWGIESDILADGSLDYDDAQLKRFDFVVASVHSRFQMDRDTMTARVLEAVRNPYTRFLGHATGRLLLGREGFDIDMPRVIEAASGCDVAIEINANPARLDIDWRWGPELRAKGTVVSVNPDAHAVAGLEDTRFGIAMARKALLPASQVINSRPLQEVERWLKRG